MAMASALTSALAQASALALNINVSHGDPRELVGELLRRARDLQQRSLGPSILGTPPGPRIVLSSVRPLG